VSSVLSRCPFSTRIAQGFAVKAYAVRIWIPADIPANNQQHLWLVALVVRVGADAEVVALAIQTIVILVVNLHLAVGYPQNETVSKSRGKYTSQYKGLSLEKGRWRVRLRLKDRDVPVGFFTCELDAALAYDAVAREQFGEFACCNFPPKKPCSNRAPASTLGTVEVSA
jgi:hypothetical protein